MANIDLGMDIVGVDGEKLGVVDSLVMDPKTGEVRSIVLRKGWFFPTDIIIPMQAVTAIDEQQVRVNFGKEDAENMTEYMDADYMTPPAGYFGTSGVFWPVANVYASNSSLVVDDQIHERDPDAIILSEGTLVVDQDGEDVGRITELATDERGRVSGFKVEEGLLRHHERYIPAHFIAAADDNLVRLSAGKADLEELRGQD
jgi:sporulation protein YlmC with PRC-barrel domain